MVKPEVMQWPDGSVTVISRHCADCDIIVCRDLSADQTVIVKRTEIPADQVDAYANAHYAWIMALRTVENG